jgi:hypothetical protein
MLEAKRCTSEEVVLVVPSDGQFVAMMVDDADFIRKFKVDSSRKCVSVSTPVASIAVSSTTRNRYRQFRRCMARWLARSTAVLHRNRLGPSFPADCSSAKVGVSTNNCVSLKQKLTAIIYNVTCLRMQRWGQQPWTT